MAMCPKCGRDNLPDSTYCAWCGSSMIPVPIAVPAPPGYKYDSGKIPEWQIATIVVVVLVIIGVVVGAFLWGGEVANLDTSNMGFIADYWTDSVDVWCTVTNNGNGVAEDIVLYFTVEVDNIPSYHTGRIYESLIPGESANGRWTFFTDTQYTDSYIVVRLTKITWTQ